MGYAGVCRRSGRHGDHHVRAQKCIDTEYIDTELALAQKPRWADSKNNFTTSDWSSCECHPLGDKIVLLMFGEITFTLQTHSGETPLSLA
jgi:hypothetical protein